MCHPGRCERRCRSWSCPRPPPHLSRPPEASRRAHACERALAHEEADRVPLDLGGSLVTGMHVSSVYKLRQALGLDPPGTPVKVIEIYQMLGEIAPDLDGRARRRRRRASPGSTTPTASTTTDWKQWSAFDGIPMLVPGEFPTEREPNGDILMYPCADRERAAVRADAEGRASTSTRSSVRTRSTRRQLDPADNTEEFGPISDADLAHIAAEVRAARADRPRDLRRLRRHELRRHRVRAGPDAAPSEGHPRPRAVVHEPRHRARTTSMRCSSASARSRSRTSSGSTARSETRSRCVFVDRRGLRHPAGAADLAEDLSQPVQAVPRPHQRLDPREHRMEDVHPLVRLDLAAARRHRRRRLRRAQPGADARRPGWSRRR